MRHIKELASGCLVTILISICGFCLAGILSGLFLGISIKGYFIPIAIVGLLLSIPYISERISKRKAIALEMKIREEEKRQQEENLRLEQERQQRIKEVNSQIVKNSVFVIDIIPFLEYLENSDASDQAYYDTVRQFKDKSYRLKQKAEEINKSAN